MLAAGSVEINILIVLNYNDHNDLSKIVEFDL